MIYMRTTSRTLIFCLLFLCGILSGERSSISEEDNINIRISPLAPRVVLAKPTSVTINSAADPDHIVIKLAEGTRLRINGPSLQSLNDKSLASVNSVLRQNNVLNFRPLVDVSPEIHERRQFIYEQKSRQTLADFNNYIVMEISSNFKAEEIINQLLELPEVEIAYARPKSYPAVDLDPPTSSFVDSQTYLAPAPEGVDAYYGWTVSGGDGTGVRIADIEGSWTFDHEDLEVPLTALLGGDANLGSEWRSHGSAVIGVLIAGDNGYGITGIVPEAEIAMVSHNGQSSDAEAILTAVDSLDAGDIILIEIQTPGPRYDFQFRTDQLGYIPIEYFQAEFDAVQYAWAKGIIVVEVAGNGAENLSDVIYENRFDTTFRNSHAIFVGAGAPPSGNFGTDRKILDFSNYGNRVNLQGYGREVVTCGYGDLFNGGVDERQFYTSLFGGTSGAAPMIAGAVASLQGIYKNRYSGAVIEADRIRDILIATGSPQQDFPTSHIGPRPDIQAADSALPEPYLLSTDPAYIDTTIEVGTQFVIPIELANSSPSSAIDFSITIPDSLVKNPQSSWLSISSGSGTILPTESVILDVTLDATAIDDRTTIYKGILEVSFGEQGGSLDEHIFIPVYLDVPCNDTLYSVSASGDIDGPDFEWYDLTILGFEIPAYSWYNDDVTEDTLDDGTTGPHFLGFDFPFYDTIYTDIYIGANGAISFTDRDVNINGLFTDIDIPNPPFTTLVAPFWNDLNLELDDGHGSVYIYRMPLKEGFIVEYNQIGSFGDIDDTLTTFQVILYRNGNIKCQYQSVGSGDLADTAVIGISDFDCKSAAFVVRSNPIENVVSDSSTVLFDFAEVVWEMSGDANSDNAVNIGDAVFLINWIFNGGFAPQKPEEADANCDGSGNIGDAVYLINYIFNAGADPCLYEL